MKARFLGIAVDDFTMDALHSLIGDCVSAGKKVVIAHHNLHSLYILHQDEEMRRFYEQAEYAHIDGMPLVWLGRLFGHPLERKHRITYVDWIRPLMAEAEKKGWRVFFLGGKPGVGDRAADILRGEFPRLLLQTEHGYFDIHPDSPDNRRILEQIREYRPHVLLVGMGMPRQEAWILNNRHQLSANVILPCGACMDYVAGEIPTPPRWMGRLGLEWLYRLFSEPKRLWRRYLVEPWFVLRLVLKEWKSFGKAKAMDRGMDG